MFKRQITAAVMAVVLASFTGPLALAQQAAGRIAGTAIAEVKQPFTDYQVRARVITTGAIAATSPLDDQAKFVFPTLVHEKYMVELVRTRDSKVVCSEGPFTLTPTNPAKTDVDISCGVPALAWLLPAAAGLGVTVALTRGAASGSR